VLDLLESAAALKHRHGLPAGEAQFVQQRCLDQRSKLVSDLRGDKHWLAGFDCRFAEWLKQNPRSGLSSATPNDRVNGKGERHAGTARLPPTPKRRYAGRE
jgi:hypothetical protein